MSSPAYTAIFRNEGFVPTGSLDYRLRLSIWWNPAPDRLMQVIVFSVGTSTLLKGDKTYFLKSIGPTGETWARDIGGLHDYLEGHFPELRISFSHFRDVPPHLAESEVRRCRAIQAPSEPVPSIEELAMLQTRLAANNRQAEGTARMFDLMGRPGDLLGRALSEQIIRVRHASGELQHQIQRQRERVGLLEHLQREYQRKGSAAAYTFTISSHLQVATSESQFRDALRAVVKELSDAHRFEVSQKLNGGRLNIHIAEATEPAMVWIEQWMGGALSPVQVGGLGPEFEALRRAAADHALVTPDEAITVDDAVRHAGKHLAAHVLADVVQRLDKTDAVTRPARLSPAAVAPESLPLLLGQRVDESGKLIEPAVFPLAQMVHLYISGTTGGGKSFLARVLIEEAAQHRSLSILVLDPRNQSVGILVAEDRSKILEQYEGFDMKPGAARGFAFDYFAPALPFAVPLPADLSKLAAGRSIVSFKGLDDERRCGLAAKVLDAVFLACSDKESEAPRLLILVDEAQLFTRKRVDDSAKEAASRVERSLDRLAREGRKFGIQVALVSQTVRDFGYDLASVRQMTTTKIFLRNSGREIEYANDIIGDGRLLAQLPTGTALIHNPDWGLHRVRVRPPYSKVFELPEYEVRRLVGRGSTAGAITRDAAQFLSVIQNEIANSDQPLNMSRAGTAAGIGSKRKLMEMVEELQRAGLIRTKKLHERGQPRVIEIVRSGPTEQ